MESNRRMLLSSVGSSAALLIAGCTSAEDSEEESTNTTDSELDTVIDFSSHVEDPPSEEYELPDSQYGNWSWIVVDFEVLEGELDMGDIWFNGLFETEERYYTISPLTDQVENGVESRGQIREGGQGVLLHAYPPSPASELIGPVFSATDSSIGGDGVIDDGPRELYPSASVEYTVETDPNPNVLSDEYTADSGEKWAVVTLNVTEGLLNIEDVWFRSQLTTESRIHDAHPYSRFADYGVRSRGLVKQGYTANILYKIGENESTESWGYDEPRQEVSISRR